MTQKSEYLIFTHVISMIISKAMIFEKHMNKIASKY